MDLSWMGGNRLAFLGVGMVFGWVLAMLLFVWLSGRRRGAANSTAPGDEPDHDRDHTFDFIVMLLAQRGMLLRQREGDPIPEGLSYKALHEKHPAVGLLTVRRGPAWATLRVWRNGDVTVDTYLDSGWLKAKAQNQELVGYLQTTGDVNPNPSEDGTTPGFVAVTLAREQPQYEPLQVLVGPAPERAFFSRFTMDEASRAAIWAGGDIWLQQLTFGHHFQPVLLSVGVPDELKQPAAWAGQ